MGDINEFMQAHPKVNLRHFVQPSEPLASGLNELNLDNSTCTYPMQMIGRKDAQNIIQLEEGIVFQHLAEWYDDLNLRQEYASLQKYLKALYP